MPCFYRGSCHAFWLGEFEKVTAYVFSQYNNLTVATSRRKDVLAHGSNSSLHGRGESVEPGSTLSSWPSSHMLRVGAAENETGTLRSHAFQRSSNSELPA